MSMKVSAIPSFVVLVVSLVGASTQTAEKHIHDREQLWGSYFNQTPLTKTFGLWLDIQYRMTGDFVNRPFQVLLRSAFTYYIKDNQWITHERQKSRITKYTLC